MGPPASKAERLSEFFQRLRLAPTCGDWTAARKQLEEIMNAVEDERSGIPFNSDAAAAPPDGRMYPPHDKYLRDSGSPYVQLFGHVRHRTAFGVNGAIKITLSDGAVAVDKPGSDGRTVDDLHPEVVQ
jgi:hypothetical protein